MAYASVTSQGTNSFGLIKLDLKTKSENGLEFTSSGSANTETTKVNGSLETKYRWTEYGLTFTEKWNTDNTLGTEITVEDQLTRGLKLTFDSSFSPNTGLYVFWQLKKWHLLVSTVHAVRKTAIAGLETPAGSHGI
ncbi:voltage-dependent anion-selective channel protein 1 [Cricetulus griseus]|nr:voltage-dependent anion-selective channel protein 1 [Cricetulus griseus]